MIVLSDARAFQGARSVVALGTFDGVHLGHRALIGRAVDGARAQSADAVAFSFDRHPLALIAPQRAPAPLLSADQRRGVLAGLGLDVLIEQPFTRAFANLSPEAFAEFIAGALRPVAVVAGYNFTFGAAGSGDSDMLRRLGARWGFEAVIVPPVCADGAPVSSTRIRELRARGDWAGAARLMGEDLSVRG